MEITREPFGELDGQAVERFTLKNDHGVAVKIITYGGTVTSLLVPDRDGNTADIVCGFDTLEGYFGDEYKANSPYFGCLVGRYAARIKDGKFSIDAAEHQVARNDGPNHLHGGIKGFDKRIWDVVGTSETDDSVSLTLSLDSEDGEESFPGNLKVQVEYQLTNGSELRIHYTATTDRATPVSLTNHTYFNLNGFSDKVLDHIVQLHSDRFLVPDETNVPVGAEEAVAGTSMCPSVSVMLSKNCRSALNITTHSTSRPERWPRSLKSLSRQAGGSSRSFRRSRERFSIPDVTRPTN